MGRAGSQQATDRGLGLQHPVQRRARLHTSTRAYTKRGLARLMLPLAGMYVALDASWVRTAEHEARGMAAEDAGWLQDVAFPAGMRLAVPSRTLVTLPCGR
jgi:hypothetical protein